MVCFGLKKKFKGLKAQTLKKETLPDLAESEVEKM